MRAVCSNVFGVVKSLLIAKHKKERDANYPVSLTRVKQEKKWKETTKRSNVLGETWKNVHLVGQFL